MRRGLLIVGALLSTSALAVALMPEWKAALRAEKHQPAPKQRSAVISVEAVPVEVAVHRTDLRSVGSLASDESVQVASEISGRIARFAFAEGQSVAAGAELIALDDGLARAEVADAQARFDLAQANRERARALSRTGNVTERAQDEAVANLETARAALDLAKVRLSKHVIRAPFSGVVGLRRVSVGAFVGVGAPIVNLEKIDVLKVNFKLPEVALAQVGIGQKVDVEVDAVPGRVFSAEVYALDPQVDINGRSLNVRARMENPGLILRPGLFVRVVVRGKETKDVVVVPESAVVPRGGETFVYQVADNKAVEVKVALGQRANGQVQILSGLAPGSVVVVAGQLKLRNGVPVEVVQAPLSRPTGAEKRG